MAKNPKNANLIPAIKSDCITILIPFGPSINLHDSAMTLQCLNCSFALSAYGRQICLTYSQYEVSLLKLENTDL